MIVKRDSVDATVYEIIDERGPYKIVVIGDKGTTWGPEMLEWIEKHEGPIEACYGVDVAFSEN